MVGAMIGQPSTALWSTVRARPSEMTPMSLLVPPMSMVATSRKPMRPAMNWAPTTPPAGPDITVRTGSERAVRLVMTPAVRLHHEQLALEAAFAQRLREAVQIGRDDRNGAGVDRHRGRALELPQLARDVGGDRDVRGGVFLQDDLPGAALMGRVGVGMEEAERDGANAEGRDAPRHRAGGVLVERVQHIARVAHALDDLEAQVPRDDRLRLDPLEVIHARVVGAHDLQHVPKSSGRDQRGLRQLSLKQRVEHHGRAMHEVVDIGERDASGRPLTLGRRTGPARRPSARLP